MIEEAKFAAGPWAIHPVDDTLVARQLPDGSWEEIAAIDGDYNQPDLWPVMEANARLIAAAPDLYEALTWALAEIEGHTRRTEEQLENCLVIARAALSKAEGK